MYVDELAACTNSYIAGVAARQKTESAGGGDSRAAGVGPVQRLGASGVVTILSPFWEETARK